MISYIFNFLYRNTSEILNVLLIGGYFFYRDIPDAESIYLTKDFICDADSPVFINVNAGIYSVKIHYSGENNYNSVYFMNINEEHLEIQHVLGDKEIISFVIENGKIFLKCQEFILGTMIITKI
jgi:hypothetical protein